MSDARWTDVANDIDNALMHLGMAIRIFEAGGFDAPDLDGYKNVSSLMHALAAGYTAIENALTRTLDILGETSPTGTSWHKDLIDRVSRPMTGKDARPAFFDAAIRRDLIECMRMRHRVRHSEYDEFIPAKTEPAVDAARRIVSRLRQAIAQVKAQVDPDPEDENDGGEGSGGSS